MLSGALVGGVFALAARESGQRGARALAWAVAAAGGLSLAIEGLHAVTPWFIVDTTTVVLTLAGAALGAAMVARSDSTDARRWIAPALAAWGAAVVMASWSPPEFSWPAPPFRTEWVVPFWSYFFSRSLLDLMDVIGQALRFVPMGALLAARTWRQSFLGTVLIGLSIGAVLETGQVFLPGRKADMTDVLSSAAGAGLGWALWRWGESLLKTSQGVARYRVGRGRRSHV
jgi:glycopeptide antibiotics resistance protein